MNRPKIPFNRPFLTPNALDRVQEAYRNSRTSGAGKLTEACERHLEAITGCSNALLTTSCTHALEMCALLLDLNRGDEVIMPCFTFVSTANAFVLRGGKPVFVDIRKDTLNIDETKIRAAITPRTKAIVVVHYAGIGCEMDAILSIAREYGIPVVEDNAHGLFATYRGQPLGSFGCLATQSFHETKNVSCGEGGALLINDRSFLDRAEVIREKGTNRSQFFRGETQKYSWVDVGSSYVISEVLAGILLAALEDSTASQASRKHVWETYRQELEGWSLQNSVRLPVVPGHLESPYHLFHLLLPTEEKRDRLITHLAQQHVAAVFHYLPLSESKMAKKLGSDRASCPVTQEVSRTILRLPLYNYMEDREIEAVLDAVRSFR